MTFIDLSHKIYQDMPVNPFDSEVKIIHDKTLETDHYNAYRIESGLHMGTHIDSPLHFIDGGKYISDIEIERFYGNGVMLDVRDMPVIGYREEFEDKISASDIVLLYTGFDKFYGSSRYYAFHPILDISFAEFIVRKKIKFLGMDMFSPDRHPFDVHKLLFKNDILILENLTNLSKLNGIPKFSVIAFPPKIEAEASPLRVVAAI